MKWALIVGLMVVGAVAGYMLLLPGSCEAPPVDASVINRGLGPEPESVDPHRAVTTQAHTVVRDLFEGLVRYSRDGKVVAGVAERWDLSDDGLEYTFWLRPDARWSNGEAVTADDFVYSFRRLVDPVTASPYAEHLSPIVNATDIVAGTMPPQSLAVTAENARMLTIRIDRPTAHFLQLLMQPPASPVNARSIAEHGERFSRPKILVSNGAYTFQCWTLGSVLDLRRNPQYWQDAETAIDVVRHHVAPEPSTELYRYLAGELDTTSTVSAAAFARMKKERPDELRVAPTLGTYYYGFNLNHPELGSKPKLREALSMAIDRELIAGKVVGRGESPAYSFVRPGTSNYDPPRLTYADMSAADRHARARQLYAESGYSEQNPLQIEVRYNSSATHESIALAIRDMWRDVLQFEADLIKTDFATHIAVVQARQVTEIFRLAWTADYDDAYSFLGILKSGDSNNHFSYQSEKFDELIDEAINHTDLTRRRLSLEEAERHMLAEHPMIPIYFYVGEHMVSPRVKGWQDNVLDYHYSQHLSLDDSK